MTEQRNRRSIRREERMSRQQEARRREILDVARGLLSRDGISHFYMEAVAEEGGYSRTSIYRYFSSKEDLVMELAIESVALRVELYRRILTFDAKPRERLIAFGEVTAMLYPRHVLAEVFASAPAVRKAATADRRRRLLELDQEQEGYILEVARDAVDRGDWKLGGDLTVEEALFGLSAMTRGLFDRIDSQFLAPNIRDPRRVLRSMGSRLLDSLQWRPFSNEWDYGVTMRRIYTELFSLQSRIALGLDDEEETGARRRVAEPR
jgi:AcrR family transcriptional regulator